MCILPIALKKAAYLGSTFLAGLKYSLDRLLEQKGKLNKEHLEVTDDNVQHICGTAH